MQGSLRRGVPIGKSIQCSRVQCMSVVGVVSQSHQYQRQSESVIRRVGPKSGVPVEGAEVVQIGIDPNPTERDPFDGACSENDAAVRQGDGYSHSWRLYNQVSGRQCLPLLDLLKLATVLSPPTTSTPPASRTSTLLSTQHSFKAPSSACLPYSSSSPSSPPASPLRSFPLPDTSAPSSKPLELKSCDAPPSSTVLRKSRGKEPVRLLRRTRRAPSRPLKASRGVRRLPSPHAFAFER